MHDSVNGNWARDLDLGIMQPYLFPYLGYFQLIHASARWVVFDTTQYMRHGWVNRNRILHPSEGWQYVTAPLAKHARETPIHEVVLVDPEACLQRIAGQMTHYKKRAPFYAETMALLEECFAGGERRLARLNLRALDLCCQRLGLPFEWRLHSELRLSQGPVEGPGDWALAIAKACGARRYVNPAGGEEIFRLADFEAAGIDLRFLRSSLRPYPQGGRPFEAGLSILDVFMWNAPEDALEMVADYTLVPPGMQGE